MRDLSPIDFVSFFKAVYQYDPFPWQVRLAEQVTAAGGQWPDTISVPTASGKTACLDVAVFSMALQADRSDNQVRTAPRRIFFVVDRRLIVEEAYIRGLNLAKRLRHAVSSDGIVWEVAERLRRLATGVSPLHLMNGVTHSTKPTADVNAWLRNQPPLACYQMRGGIYRDNAWTRTPMQPSIITSTVDQVGSRMLYRGYGVSEFSRALHAGLTANDSLIILDEAHCSNPFRQTMHAVDAYRRWHESDSLQESPFNFVSLSATPSTDAKDILKIEKEDEAKDSHKELDRRIRASKVTTLFVSERAKGKPWLKHLAEDLADQAVQLQLLIGSAAIGIIVNRVATAREVRKLLVERLGSKADVALMTGRMREVDRRKFLAEWQPRLVANPYAMVPRELECPAFIVATQCLEVGANLDFDALVTECASLDALRQRFGRLNRLGQRAVAKAVIVIRGDQTEESDDPKRIDPIYGVALPRTWAWLNRHSREGTVDLGIASVASMLPIDDLERRQELVHLQPNASDALVMLPAHLDALVQSSPVPCPDPDISLFLHGFQRRSPDIQVCWRADLVLPCDSSTDDTSIGTAWIEAISLCPPAASECLNIPLFLFENWIETGRVDVQQLTDVEGNDGVEYESKNGDVRAFRFLRWCGPTNDRTELLYDTAQLRPGDTVILPTWMGGFDCLGDIPGLDGSDVRGTQDMAATADCGDEANLLARFKPILRINEILISHWPQCEARDKLIQLSKEESLVERVTTSEFAIEVADALKELAQDATLRDRRWTWLCAAALSLSRQLRRRASQPTLHLMSYGWSLSGDDLQYRLRNIIHPGGFVIRGSRLTPKEAQLLFELNADEEDYLSMTDSFTHEDDSSSIGVTAPVTLREHTSGVVAFADHFTTAARLSPIIAADIQLAARLHDIGKSDPRFQAWLLGGAPRVARIATETLAKSGISMDQASSRLARVRSGYPNGARHELLSIRLTESATEWLSQANDPDLVLHLIGAHHGCCRPFAPVVNDTTSGSIKRPFDLRQLANAVGMSDPIEPEIAAERVLPTRLDDVSSGVGRRFWLLVRRYGWWGLAWLETHLILADRCESQREQEIDEEPHDAETLK